MERKVIGCVLTHLFIIFLIFGSVGLLFQGCGTISFQNPQQEDITDLAISIASKQVGIKLAEWGFKWDNGVETWYQKIVTQEKLSIDAATITKDYIEQNIDPLLRSDMLKLASMIGVDFDPLGNIVSTDKVNMRFVKTAIEGIRLAVQLKQK